LISAPRSKSAIDAREDLQFMPAPLNSYDVIIAGAGPAGSSASIHLALRGARVLLVEQKKFPREKLCGEFISPECLKHFEQLGVADRMLSAGGEALSQTVFYSRGGRSVSVPSSWFDNQNEALGLSRAEMDLKLLQRARAVGVEVLEETQVSSLLHEGPRVRGVNLRSQAGRMDARASVVVDATGRARALVRSLDREEENGARRPRRTRPSLVAFKAHLQDTQLAAGTCEIYFYPGGYGGLSRIENGLSNLCLIASAKDVRACNADPETVMNRIVAKNSRAAYALGNARLCGEWLAVALESFGRQELVPAEGLLMIGDAAAFIDPFTGSGMLMALQSGELASGVIMRHLPALGDGSSFAALAGDYRALYRQRFKSRLRVCALLRRAAFVPRFADAAIRLFGSSERLRLALARATRGG
jgi:flavin-dependent dehydrogenase